MKFCGDQTFSFIHYFFPVFLQVLMHQVLLFYCALKWIFFIAQLFCFKFLYFFVLSLVTKQMYQPSKCMFFLCVFLLILSLYIYIVLKDHLVTPWRSKKISWSNFRLFCYFHCFYGKFYLCKWSSNLQISIKFITTLSYEIDYWCLNRDYTGIMEDISCLITEWWNLKVELLWNSIIIHCIFYFWMRIIFFSFKYKFISIFEIPHN